jgi:hypothetical protein
MLRDVVPAQLIEGLLARGGDVIPGQRVRVAAHVLETLVTRRGGDEQHDRVGLGDGKLVLVGAGLAAGDYRLNAGLKL